MLRIYKYGMGRQELPAGPDGKIVAVGMDYNHDPCFWALVDPTAPKIARYFAVAATGDIVPESCTYHGKIEDLPYIWHVIEIPANMVTEDDK